MLNALRYLASDDKLCAHIFVSEKKSSISHRKASTPNKEYRLLRFLSVSLSSITHVDNYCLLFISVFMLWCGAARLCTMFDCFRKHNQIQPFSLSVLQQQHKLCALMAGRTAMSCSLSYRLGEVICACERKVLFLVINGTKAIGID